MEIKQKTAVIIGYGNRGQVYADYSLDCPNELKIIGIVDPNPFKLSFAKERYNLKEENLFKSVEEFIKAKIQCDFVVNSTMDQYHYETAIPLLKAGYNMLMEKPIVPNEKQLMEIKRTADENNCKVFVCHVLRYTPYYKRIKQIILDGTIGDIMTMEMNEHVCMAHYLTSYVRGKWNTEENCGSGFILAKSCHDLDLMCWLNNSSAPKYVTSMGSRSRFIEKNKPEGASDFCYKCKHERNCPYSAVKLYVDMNTMPFLVWDKLNKPLDQITMDERKEFIKQDIYGRCAYDDLGDIVDRQNSIVTFENGSQCSFTLVGGTVKADRYLHICGTTGEIEGKLEENKFTLRKYIDGSYSGTAEVIDISEEVVNNAKYGGHSGGDFAIMHDLIAYLNGDRSSVSITSLDDSVNGHLCVYASELSRKENRIIDIEKIK